MKLQTTEEAIKWMVDNPEEWLWATDDLTDSIWSQFRFNKAARFFSTIVAVGVAPEAQIACRLPSGPYYTEKPKAERTIEESLEKLKGEQFHIKIDDQGYFAAGLNLLPPLYPVSAPTLQATLSALVDEIEEGE